MTWLAISAAALIGFALGAALGYPWGSKHGFEKAVAIGLGLEIASRALDEARVANKPSAEEKHRPVAAAPHGSRKFN